MTLVVASIVGGVVHVLSDSLITDRSEIARWNGHPLAGTLKSVILTTDLCVSFAGSRNVALDAIRTLSSRGHINATEVVRYLHDVHLGTGAPEFLIATPSRLWQVSNGIIRVDDTDACIGHADAVAAYLSHLRQHESVRHQQAREIQDVSADMIEFLTDKKSIMADAFREVVEDPRHPTVGGFTMQVSFSRAGFRYQAMYAGFDYKPVTATREPTSLLQGKNAADGGYEYTILVPIKDQNASATGVYVFQGRFGALFMPLRQDVPVLFTNVSIEEFVAEARTKHSIELTGIGLS